MLSQPLKTLCWTWVLKLLNRLVVALIAPWKLGLKWLCWVTDIWCQVLLWLGGQPAGASALAQVSSLQQRWKRLELQTRQQNHELQSPAVSRDKLLDAQPGKELREQLAAEAALKSALASKYKHARSLNVHLQQTLLDMEAAAADTAAVLDTIQPPAAAPASILTALPTRKTLPKGTLSHSSSASALSDTVTKETCLRHRRSTASTAPEPPSTPAHSTRTEPSARRHRDAAAHTIQEQQQQQQVQPVVGPGRRCGFVWGTHMALLAAWFVMRWCDQVLLEATRHVRRVSHSGDMNIGGAQLWQLVQQEQLKLGRGYWWASWLLPVAYCLWCVRVLPATRIVNRGLATLGWLMVGFCAQAGWMAQRVMLVTVPLVASGAGGAGGGQMMCGVGSTLVNGVCSASLVPQCSHM